MAPRAGLEPATNGLTVQITHGFNWGKLKNPMGFSNAESSSHSKSEPIPKLPYDSLPESNPNLCLRCSRASYGKGLWQTKPWPEPELVPKSGEGGDTCEALRSVCKRLRFQPLEDIQCCETMPLRDIRLQPLFFLNILYSLIINKLLIFE